MIRVLLVDDQELVRSGFRVILDSEPGLEVIAEAADGAEAVRIAASLAPDVICMDVEMPVMNGIEAVRQILSASEANHDDAPAILILTTFGHERYLFDALAAGVSGFLLKTSSAEQLIEAVRALAAGQALLGPDVTRAVIERIAEDRAGLSVGARAEPGTVPGGTAEAAKPTASASVSCDSAALDAVGLTEREQEVMRLLAEGRSNAEIAESLFLGESTVKTHVSNILQKLQVRDRIQAVVWAHTHGMRGA